MSIPYSRDEKIRGALIESTATPGQVGLVVLDSTGADISGGGGGAQDTNLIRIAGNAVNVGAGAVGTGTQRMTLASDDLLVASTGASADAAATAGSTGTVQAKLRLATSQLDSIKAAVEIIDNIVSGTSAQTVGNIAADAADSGNPIKIGGVYNAALPNYDDGDRTNMQTDQYGRILINPRIGAYDVDASAALEATSLIKSIPGNIVQFSGRLDSTAPTGTYYLQFINASSVPANGAVSLLTAPVKLQHTTGVDTPIVLHFLDEGLYGSTGLVWCLSSTEFTKTTSGAYVSATVRYY